MIDGKRVLVVLPAFNAARTLERTLAEIPAGVVDKVGAPYVKVTIPANTYTGQAEAVQTAAVVNYLVSHSGVKDETVYEMTKAIYENLPELVAAHAAARDIKLETAMQGMPIPMHPGAERYLKEKGITKQGS